MTASKEPWWRPAHEAAHRLASTIDAAASRASRDGVYTPPPGSSPPRRRRRPGSLRHLAEVIRAHRLAPGLSVDKDIVARVLEGDLRYITDPTAVIAVARASCLIAGVTFNDDDAQRLTVACAYVATLVEAAREADRRAPDLVPAVRGAREAVQVGQPARAPHPGASVALLDAPRMPRPTPAAAGVLIVAVIGALLLFAGSNLPSLAARNGRAAPEKGPAAAPTVNPNCDQGAPPTGTDLLDVPHRHPPSADGAKMNDWWPNNGHIEMNAYGLRSFDATVHTGEPNLWDLVILRSCLPLVAGRPYKLSLTAWASAPVKISVRVQEPNGVVMNSSTDLRVGPQSQQLVVPFAGSATSRQDELLFQVGGHPADYRLRVTGITLTS